MYDQNCMHNWLHTMFSSSYTKVAIEEGLCQLRDSVKWKIWILLPTCCEKRKKKKDCGTKALKRKAGDYRRSWLRGKPRMVGQDRGNKKKLVDHLKESVTDRHWIQEMTCGKSESHWVGNTPSPPYWLVHETSNERHSLSQKVEL